MTQAQRVMHLRLRTMNLHLAETRWVLVIKIYHNQTINSVARMIFRARVLHKPGGDSSGYDALSPTRYESTLTRNEAGAGNENISQSNDKFSRKRTILEREQFTPMVDSLNNQTRERGDNLLVLIYRNGQLSALQTLTDHQALTEVQELSLAKAPNPKRGELLIIN